MRKLWGRGSAGRAMRSQRIGQGFESPRLHQKDRSDTSVFCCFRGDSAARKFRAARAMRVNPFPTVRADARVKHTGKFPATSGLCASPYGFVCVQILASRYKVSVMFSARFCVATLLTSPLVSTKTKGHRNVGVLLFCVVIGERTGAQKRFSFEARIDFQMCEGGQKCAQVRLAPQDAFALCRRRERVGKQAGRRAYAQDDIMAKLPSSSYVFAGTLRCVGAYL